MSYKYVTENNLENKQHYMYSEYEGVQFLNDYLKNRAEALKVLTDSNGKNTLELSCILKNIPNGAKGLKSLPYKDTQGIVDKIIWEEYQHQEFVNKRLVDLYIKKFEATKELKRYYDVNLVKINSESGKKIIDYDYFVRFTLLVWISYQKTKNLKYLNTMLKLNDINISIERVLSNESKQELIYCIKREVEMVESLLDENNIQWRNLCWI